MFANLASVPLFLRAFGTDLYGYWGALLGLTSYLGLLNLGIAQTVSSRVSTTDRERDPGAIAHVVRAGIRAYIRICGWAIPALAVVCASAPWNHWFHLEARYGNEARWAALAVAVTFLLELPFSVFRAALYGLGEVSAERAIAMAGTLVRLAVAWLCAVIHPPLWLAVLLLSATNIAGFVACTVVLRRRFPEVFRTVDHRPESAEGAAQFRSASFHFLLLQIAGAITWSTDAVFAGMLIGTAAAAKVSVAWRVLMIVLTLGSLVGPALGPALAQAWARGDKQRATVLGLQAAQILVAVVMVCALGSLVVGEAAFRLWLGEGMFVGATSWALFCGVLVFQGLLIIPHAFVVQAGTHEGYARFTLAEAALKVVLTLTFMKLLGLPGLPLATLVARAATTLWYLPIVYARELGLRTGAWLWEVVRPIGAPTAAFLAVLLVGRMVPGAGQPWAVLGLGVLCGLVFSAVFLAYGLPPELRQRLLSGWRRRRAGAGVQGANAGTFTATSNADEHP